MWRSSAPILLAVLCLLPPAEAQQRPAIEATDLVDGVETDPSPGDASTQSSWHNGLFPPATVYIEPLLLAPEEVELVEDAAHRLAALFHLRVIVRESDAPWPGLVNSSGEPYQAGDTLSFPTIAEALRFTWRRLPGLPDALAILAVSGTQIVYPTSDGEHLESATWSLRSQGIATVSLPDLLADPNAAVPLPLVRMRIERALARMLGQALGLAPNPNNTSVMFRPGTGERLVDVPWALSETELAELRIIRALCAIHDGRTEAAALERAIDVRRVSDDQDGAVASLAAILRESRGSRDAAGAIDQALALDPRIGRLHLSRARLAYRKAQFERAADLWDRVEALHPYAASWTDTHLPFDLLWEQGLPNRPDSTLAVQNPLATATEVLGIGDGLAASTAAYEALANDGQHRSLDDRALYTNAPPWARDAGILLARALTAKGDWQAAAEALAIVEPHLTERDRRNIEHIETRVGLGLGLPWRGRTATPRSYADRLRLGWEAMQNDDAVAVLDAWAALADALESPWAPNVPVNTLAQLAADHGAHRLATHILELARTANVLDAAGHELHVRVAKQARTETQRSRWRGEIKRYAVRRFQPQITTTSTAVWIGTSDGLFRIARDDRTTSLQHVARGLPAGAITHLASVGETLWLATTEGLYRRDAEAWTTVHASDGGPLPRVTALGTSGGTIVVGTTSGVFTVSDDAAAVQVSNTEAMHVIAIDVRDRDVACVLATGDVLVRRHDRWSSIAPDSNRPPELVLLGDDGALQYVSATEEGYEQCSETAFGPICFELEGKYKANPVRRKDTLWSVEGQAIYRRELSDAEWTRVAETPDGDMPIAIHPEDTKLWVVTPYAVYTLVEDRFELIVRNTPNNIWSHVVPAQSGVWKLTGRGITPPDGINGPRILPLRGLAGPGVVVLDEAGTPWAIAGRRLYKGRNVWRAVADIPREAGALRLWLLHDDTLWASDEQKAWSWSRSDGWRSFGTPAGGNTEAPRVRGVAATADGTIWVARSDRIQRWDGAQWHDVEQSPRHLISSLAAAGEDVWVGTVHGGMYRLGSAPAHWTSDDGLPSNRISQVATAAGQVWATSPDGGFAAFDGDSWKTFYPGNLASPLVADDIVPLPDGTLWLRVGETWYEQLPDAG